MPKYLMHKHTNQVVEVLATDGPAHWVKSVDGDRRWTVTGEEWVEPTPKVGDVWRAAHDDDFFYRVIGINEADNSYFIVPKSKWHDGAWPLRVNGGRDVIQVEADVDLTDVFIRRIPENYMVLVERPHA
jgi:hypothetical protein